MFTVVSELVGCLVVYGNIIFTRVTCRNIFLLTSPLGLTQLLLCKTTAPGLYICMGCDIYHSCD